MDVPKSNPAVSSTPQNTPANAAPISSRAQQPGVGTIKEGESHCLLFLLLFCPSNPAVRSAKGLTANSNFCRGS